MADSWEDEIYPAFEKHPTPDEPTEEAQGLAAEDALELLARKIRVCRHCDLSESRVLAVPGEGNPHAAIMLVGEAPGAAEDTSGRPFVGPSGKFLDAMLRDIGLRREDIFIANINRCRPPVNRDPNPVEIEACSPWMRAQIRVIQPKVICPMGRFALAALLDPKLKISQVHGQAFDKGGILFIPLYHPAAALHRQDLRDTLIADMRHVRGILEQRGFWQ